MTLPQYAQMQKEYKAIAGGTVREELLGPSILGPGTDWQDELFDNAKMQKHQLSLSGGSNNTTYYMSGEYLDQQGVAVRTGHHCAQPLMAHLQTPGTVRASLSIYNNMDDIHRLFAAIAKVKTFLL